MDMRPNWARCSDDLSAGGCKRVWIGDLSKGCSSRCYLHSFLLIPQMGSGLLKKVCASAHMGGQVLTSEGQTCPLRHRSTPGFGWRTSVCCPLLWRRCVGGHRALASGNKGVCTAYHALSWKKWVSISWIKTSSVV